MVTNTTQMFQNCATFKGGGLDAWIAPKSTSNIQYFTAMFQGCTAFNQDLSGWKITSLLNAANMLDNCGMSTTNYSNLLIGWAAQAPSVLFTVPLGAIGRTYTGAAAVAARAVLTGTYLWVISGDTLV